MPFARKWSMRYFIEFSMFYAKSWFSKLHQVHEEIGCRHITILFDDIGLDLPDGFSSLVDAQAFTLNKLIKYFDAHIANKTLTEKTELKSIDWTTCPTYYSCKFRNNEEIPAVNYLQEFKEKVWPSRTNTLINVNPNALWHRLIPV